jgi:hypothetical protein
MTLTPRTSCRAYVPAGVACDELPVAASHHPLGLLELATAGVRGGVLEQERTGVRLAQEIQVVPCIPVGMQLGKAEVGPTSGPT